jgi:hypothetical protein
MNVRWLQDIQKEIPAFDFEDLNIQDDPQVHAR